MHTMRHILNVAGIHGHFNNFRLHRTLELHLVALPSQDLRRTQPNTLRWILKSRKPKGFMGLERHQGESKRLTPLSTVAECTYILK